MLRAVAGRRLLRGPVRMDISGCRMGSEVRSPPESSGNTERPDRSVAEGEGLESHRIRRTDALGDRERRVVPRWCAGAYPARAKCPPTKPPLRVSAVQGIPG